MRLQPSRPTRLALARDPDGDRQSKLGPSRNSCSGSIASLSPYECSNYSAHRCRHRPHRALNLRPPKLRWQGTGPYRVTAPKIRRHSRVLGGLINQYERAILRPRGAARRRRSKGHDTVPEHHRHRARKAKDTTEAVSAARRACLFTQQDVRALAARLRLWVLTARIFPSLSALPVNAVPAPLGNQHP